MLTDAGGTLFVERAETNLPRSTRQRRCDLLSGGLITLALTKDALLDGQNGDDAGIPDSLSQSWLLSKSSALMPRSVSRCGIEEKRDRRRKRYSPTRSKIAARIPTAGPITIILPEPWLDAIGIPRRSGQRECRSQS